MEKKWSKLTLIAIVLIACLVISFIIDFLFYGVLTKKSNTLDLSQVTTEYDRLENINGELKSEEDTASIIYHFPDSYIYKMVFTTQSDRRIDFTIDCEDMQQISEDTNKNSFNSETKTVVIDAVTDQIKVNFSNLDPDESFRFNLDSLNYSTRINPIRILAIFVILSMIAYISALILGLLEFKYERVALIFTLFFGILLAFLLPPSYGYDEYSHLLKTLKVSQFDLNATSETTQTLPEGFSNLERKDFRSYEDYLEEISQISSFNPNNVAEEKVALMPSATLSYTFIPYIFSSIGLKIAQLFKLNLFFWPALARLGNVLFFAFALYWALKLFPSNKPFLFFFSMLPLIFFSVISIGTSSVMLGCLMLAISYLAYLIVDKEEITWLDYTILMLIFFIVTSARVPCGLFTLTALVLPNKKIKSNSLKICNKVLTVFLTGLFIGGICIYASSLNITRTDIKGANPTQQIYFILANLLTFLMILIRYSATRIADASFFVYYGLVDNTGIIKPLVIFFMQIILVWLTLAGNKEKFAFNSIFSKIIFWLSFFLCVEFTETLIYINSTPVGAGSIENFHLYFVLIILFVPFLVFEGKRFHLEYRQKFLNNTILIFTLLMFFCFIEEILVKFYR